MANNKEIKRSYEEVLKKKNNALKARQSGEKEIKTKETGEGLRDKAAAKRIFRRKSGS